MPPSVYSVGRLTLRSLLFSLVQLREQMIRATARRCSAHHHCSRTSTKLKYEAVCRARVPTARCEFPVSAVEALAVAVRSFFADSFVGRQDLKLCCACEWG